MSANAQGGDSMSGTRAPGWPGGLTAEVAALVRERFGTPCYVYDRAGLEAAARQALAFPAPHGLTLRYAMKANPNHGILAPPARRVREGRAGRRGLRAH